MIVRISSSGTSFKGLAAYLTHDPKAVSAERVAWTHTHNLANDHVPSAVDEMYQTGQNAELLKQEFGIRAGGRSTEKPVKHISLNWSPEDKPSREHMLATTEDYLQKMGWHGHQAIFIAHSDKPYAHVHIVLSAIQPETGLRLDEGFEWRRSQAWALQYELSQNRIHCAERLKDVDERERNMPRNIWMEFQVSQRQFERNEKILEQNSPDISENNRNVEWKILKEFQRHERLTFFAQGKLEFEELRSTIYREVREEFRGRWAEFYKLSKSNSDGASLSVIKAGLVAEQKAALEPRRDAACEELRKSRDKRYRELLDHQKEIRAELRLRQDAGLDNTLFFSGLAERTQASQERALQFRMAVREVSEGHREEKAVIRSNSKGQQDAGGQVHGEQFRTGIPRPMRLLDALFTALVGEGPRPPEPDHDAYHAAAEEAAKRQQSIEYRSFDHDRLARQKAIEGD